MIDGGINVVAGIAILILGWLLSARLARWTRSGLDRLHHFDDTLKPLIASLVRYAVLVAAVLAVLERFGVETTSLITLLGAAGLAVGLALQGTLSNVASGVMLLLLRPFKVGDWITVVTPNQAGAVREIGLFTTILISADQTFVSLPNSVIFGSTIVNGSREPVARVNFTVAVDTASDTDLALKIIADTLAAHPQILKVPAAMTGVAVLGEQSVDLLVRFWVHTSDAERVGFDIRKSVHERLQQARILPPLRRQLAMPANEDLTPHKSAMRKSG